MANEFKHKDPCTTLTSCEYIGADGTGHVFASQATGDLLYADSATVLNRLARACSGSQMLQIASCKPAWTATPSLGTTSWANMNHAHGASCTGGTVCANVLAGTTLKSTVVTSSLETVGTLGALTVDDVAINGKVVTMTGSACDTIVMTAAANGAFSLVTTDTAGADGNITITADGTVDVNSAGLLTLDSGAAINIEPAACSAILLDGTISIDAGVVTGATSITSTAFVGTLDGVVGGNTPAAITGTTLSVDNFTLNGTELDLSSGDFALDVAGDVEINADGGCINFKDASLALAAIVNTSCVGELRIHEAANYVGFKTPALSGDTTYTLPAAYAGCNGMALTSTTGGVMSWASAGGSGGMTFIATAEASNDATLGVACLDTSTHESFMFVLADIVTAGDGRQLRLRLGDSGGVDSGSCDYLMQSANVSGHDAAVNASNSGGGCHIRLVTQGNACGEGGSFHGTIYTGDRTINTHMTGMGFSVNADASRTLYLVGGVRNAKLALTQVQIHTSCGNITSGRLTVWGMNHA